MLNELEPYRAYYTGPDFDEACVRDVMRAGVATCKPEASLRDVARIMVSHQIHCAILGYAHVGESPSGIVTDMDLAAAATTDMSKLSARDVASQPVTVLADEALARATQLMVDEGCTHLLVLQPLTGQPAGVLSALGIAAVIAVGRD